MTTHNIEPTPASPYVKRTSPALIAVAWIVVAVPLAWGVTQTIVRSLVLFHGTAPHQVQFVKPELPQQPEHLPPGQPPR